MAAAMGKARAEKTPEQLEAIEAGKCGAKVKHKGHRTGKPAGRPCTKTAGWGTDHPGYGSCRLHGGNTKAGKQHAAELMAKEEVANYGLPQEIEPTQALLDELHRTAGHVAYLGSKVQSLSEGEMTGPVGGAQGGYPEYKPSVWIQMYNAERDHLAKVATACIKVGIEERRVRIAEQTGQLFAQVIQHILEDLGVADDPRTPEVVRTRLMEGTELRVLEGGRESA